MNTEDLIRLCARFRKEYPIWRGWDTVSDITWTKTVEPLLFSAITSRDPRRVREIVLGTQESAGLGYPLALTYMQAERLRSKAKECDGMEWQFYHAFGPFVMDPWKMDKTLKDTFCCYWLKMGDLCCPSRSDGVIKVWSERLNSVVARKDLFHLVFSWGECLICLDALLSNQYLVSCQNVCGKVFHANCICKIPSDVERSGCPHCRTTGEWWRRREQKTVDQGETGERTHWERDPQTGVMRQYVVID